MNIDSVPQGGDPSSWGGGAAFVKTLHRTVLWSLAPQCVVRGWEAVAASDGSVLEMQTLGPPRRPGTGLAL